MVKRKFLIVTDDSILGQSMQDAFEHNHGTELYWASSLSLALNKVMNGPYCLLMVDLQLPDMDKFEMVRVFGIAKHFPILAMTGPLSTNEKIALFHAGIDVFLEKPVDINICIAQAETLVELYLKTDEQLRKLAPISFGASMVIAPRYRRVFIDGKPVELTRREFDFLYFLAQHPHQVFTRKQLYRQIWDDYYELGGDGTVKTHIQTLKRKLSILDTNLIENEWGVGYRFMPPV